MSRSWTAVRAQLAVKCRDAADPQVIADLRVELRASRAADYLQRLVNEAPPLTPSQINHLQGILASAHNEILDAAGLLDAGEQ